MTLTHHRYRCRWHTIFTALSCKGNRLPYISHLLAVARIVGGRR